MKKENDVVGVDEVEVQIEGIDDADKAAFDKL